jgi:hypothetical protein
MGQAKSIGNKLEVHGGKDKQLLFHPSSVKCGLGAKQLMALNAVTILNNQK